MRLIAGEIIATLDAEGYVVGEALGQHPAFRNGRHPASSLERSLVKDAATRAASIADMFAEPVGTGLELISIADGAQRHYRLKVATYRNGEPHIVCGASSTLLQTAQEPALMPIERWVLCFRTDDDSTIVEMFAAEVKGAVERESDGPVQLILGTVFPLDPISPPDGFFPDSDDDLGDDFNDDLDGEADEDIA